MCKRNKYLSCFLSFFLSVSNNKKCRLILYIKLHPIEENLCQNRALSKDDDELIMVKPRLIILKDIDRNKKALFTLGFESSFIIYRPQNKEIKPVKKKNIENITSIYFIRSSCNNYFHYR